MTTTRLIESLESPRDIERLAPDRLRTLADEVREWVETRFDMREEHLTSALGLTDLSVALHHVFDFAADRLVFDMGHQAAAHLVLTRQVALSDDDAPQRTRIPFVGEGTSVEGERFAAHAGTSISTALGLAQGVSDAGKTVAVIGDGAVATGVALEALNSGSTQAGNVLVILNDNVMSISKVVGAMAEYLAKIRVGTTYNAIKRDAHKVLQAIPFFGGNLDKAAEQLKDAVAKALVPGHIFESLGPRYFGPVDGHNLPHLVQLLREIRRHDGFDFLHVVTRREPTAAPTMEPEAIVVAAPVDDGGVVARLETELEFERQGEQRWLSLLSNVLVDLGERNEDVCCVTAVTPESRGMRRLGERFGGQFPRRFWDMGICEQHGVAFAAGLARGGRRPVVVSFSSYLQRAYDQVVQEIVQAEQPVVLVVAHAGVVGQEAAVAHGVHDIAYLRTLPGIDLLAPRDGAELERMLEWACGHDGPVAIRVPRAFAPGRERVFDVHAEFVRGKAETLRRGTDVAVLALGATVYPAMEVADRLAEKGLEATVVNARFVRPFDRDCLKDVVERHTVVFTVEEHAVRGGFGSAVLEEAAELRLDAGNIVPIALPDRLLTRGTRARVLRTYGLDPAGLADRMLHAYRRYVRGR